MKKPYCSTNDANSVNSANNVNVANSVNSAVAAFPALLTVEEAARVLKIKPRALQGLLNRGRVPGFKVGAEWRVRQDDMLALAQSVYVPAPPRARKSAPTQNGRPSSSPSRQGRPPALAASAPQEER